MANTARSCATDFGAGVVGSLLGLGAGMVVLRVYPQAAVPGSPDGIGLFFFLMLFLVVYAVAGGIVGVMTGLASTRRGLVGLVVGACSGWLGTVGVLLAVPGILRDPGGQDQSDPVGLVLSLSLTAIGIGAVIGCYLGNRWKSGSARS